MRDKVLFTVVLILALLRLYGLDFAEVQAWDEAMYGMRARSILLFGDWLDQTAHSVGGLYSAAHPPLTIWLTAFTMKFLGDTAFALRLWSALFGAATVLLLYVIPNDRLEGFFSAFVLGTCSFFSFFSRQGQLDVTLTFFIVLGIFSYVRYETSGRNGLLALTGFAFGLALMSKIIVGLLLPIAIGAFLLFLVLRGERWTSAALRQWLAVLGVGLALALPWHIYMFLEHGSSFIDYYFTFHILQRSLTGVEHNVQSLGPLFFVNQLIVLSSAGAAVCAWRIRRLRFRDDHLPWFYLSALLVPFLIFSFSKTQLRAYALPMLPPLALLAGDGLKILWTEKHVSRTVIAASIASSVWASSQEMRNAVKGLFGHPRFETVLVAAAVIIFISILSIIAARRISGRIFVLSVLGVLTVFSFTRPVEYSHSSIAEVADRFEKDDCRELIYMDKVRTVHSPHMSWYFGGIDLGWRQDRTFRMVQPEDLVTLDLGAIDCAYIIINQREETLVFEKFEELLEEEAQTISLDEHYHVYRWRSP